MPSIPHQRPIKKTSFPAKYQNFGDELFEPTYRQEEQSNGSLKDEYKPRYNDTYSSLDYSELKKILDAIHSEQQRAVKCLYDLYVADDFKPNRGVLIGSGEVSPFNVGFHVQAPHGLPYLPGSGIQGMLRNFIIQTVFDQDEKAANRDKGFALIFGECAYEGENPVPKSRGRVDFLDAYPDALGSDSLKLEVFTNHFDKYYLQESKKPIQPTDTMNPVPVQFLTLEKTTFRVYAAIRNHNGNKPIESGKFEGFPPLTVVARYLQLAFARSGVGARSKNNYGKGTYAPEKFCEKKQNRPETL